MILQFPKNLGSILINILLFFSSTVVNASAVKEKILILHDGSNMEMMYSKFLSNLRSKNFDLIFKSADDNRLQLIEYGVIKYQHLMILAPNVDEFGGDLSPMKIAEYVDNGGNLLMALDSRVTDTMRSTAAEFGVDTDTEETFIIDHFNFSEDFDQGDHTILELSVKDYYTSAKPFVPKTTSKSDKLIYTGIGMTLSNKNPLISSVLNGASSCYSWTPNTPITSMPMMLGTEVSLISVMEAKNNARVLIIGSLKFFSDEYVINNEKYAEQLALWAFQRSGVLKIENVRHYLTDNKETLDTYTIYDMITYAVDVYEKDQTTGNFFPAKNTDIQVEFTRLDPFVRQYLVKSKSSPTQYMSFKLPDTYGVFKFIINYKRIGYTFLQSEITVPVRPLQHTQYERFIVAAYPYYAGAGSMLVGLFLFSFVFLYHK